MTDALQVVYDSIGRADWLQAQTLCRRLLRDGVDTPAVHHALGISLCGDGAYDEALAPLARAVELDPVTATWSRDAGALYARLGRWTDARRVLAPVVEGLDAEGLNIFLTAACETGRAPEALGRLTPAAMTTLGARPDSACTLGRALIAVARYREAEAVLLDCLKRFPDALDAHEELACLYDVTLDRDRALQQWRVLAEAQPEEARAHLKLAIAYGDRGQWEDSRRVRLHAESLGLTHPEEYASRVYMMLSDPEETAETILAAARAAFADVPPSAQRRPQRTRRRSARRMRVGYLSSGFHTTPSYYFTYPFLTNHDRSRVEVFLYSDVGHPLDTTSAAQLGEHYMEIDFQDEARLTSVLRSDDLDVLVHMAGHFAYNGLHLLCSRMAPLQICYPNFPSTTGCPGIDYVITDRWLSPEGTDSQYSEQLYRIPGGSLAFTPPDNSPDVGDVPLSTTTAPTFGVFQRSAKFNAPFFGALAAVLKRVPTARLVIRNGDPELENPHSTTARLLRQRFAERDVDAERIVLQGPLPYHKHLTSLCQVDIALDTFPYVGQTTTCESLWMGVPVVTMAQGTHVSRVSGALLTRAGYPEWVAETPQQYVDIAARLAADVDRLASLRRSMRGDIVKQGITDGPALARALEQAYDEMS